MSSIVTSASPDPQTPPNENPEQDAAPDRASAPALILLVEDDLHSREGLAEFLLEAGYRVSEAADGPEALKKIATRHPDVVIMDLAIPRLDGWEVIRQIKANDAYRDIAVVAFSAMNYPELVERATAVGCDAFVAKPCDPVQLLAVVRGLLSRRR